jgi:short-subunit dehydrogenase
MEHPMVCNVHCSIQLLVITGATDGIGREFAFQLAKAGFGVVLVSRNPEKLQKLANEISEPQFPGR